MAIVDLSTPALPAHDADAILKKQSHLNRSTRGQWHLYRSHRERLERCLAPPQPGGRICVLGAGNCNDLDLNWLTQAYRQVQLVDLDAGALRRATEFQKLADSPRVHLVGDFDISGIASVIGGWRGKPNLDEVKHAASVATDSAAPLIAKLHGPFDCVVSPCVLSQILAPLRDKIGEDHPGFPLLLAAIRAAHLRLITGLLAPGGRGVFACDVLSSASVPVLASIEEDRLSDVMRVEIGRGRYFSGLDPRSILATLREDRELSARVARVGNPTPPWLWHLALNKTYLVYAIEFQAR